MPPAVKITTEMVIEAGYALADCNGIDSVNCRAIAAKLGCSTQPVFSRFPNMEELKEAIFVYACSKIEQEILTAGGNYLDKSIEVLTDLARNHKNLYKLVYLSDYCSESTFIETRMAYKTNQLILEEIKNTHSISEEKAIALFERISLLFHGITTVIATTSMDYSDDKIKELILGT